MIFSSNSAKEAWDWLNKIYLDTKFSLRFNILHKLLQSHQEKNESVVIYLNKIINLRMQLMGCGCNWIKDKFMVVMILQSLSTKFSHFMIIIDTRLDDKEEVFFLENISRLLLNHEEILNRILFIPSLKEHYVELGPMRTHFKKKLNNQKKSSYATKKNFKKGGNR